MQELWCGEGACQLLSGAVQVCRDSLHSAAAVIKAVADVVRCDWCSHRGHSKPGVMVKAIERLQQAENCGAGSCCKYGGAFCVREASIWFLGLLCGSLYFNS